MICPDFLLDFEPFSLVFNDLFWCLLDFEPFSAVFA